MVRRVLRNAISTLVTPANVERVLLMVVAALGKLPVIGPQITALLKDVNFGELSVTMAQQILDFILPLIPQTVGSTPTIDEQGEVADDFLKDDLEKIQAALTAAKPV